MNITLTESQRELLASLKRMRELAGRPWPGDEMMIQIALSRGLRDESDDERFIVNILKPGPLDVAGCPAAFQVQAQ